MDTDEFLAFAEPFVGIAIPAFFIIWYVLRPLSFVYRIRDGRLEVLTFFFSQAGGFDLADITRRELLERKTLKSFQRRRLRWLTPKFIPPSPRFLVIETGQHAYVLPAWMDGYLRSPHPGAAFSASKQDRWTGQANRLASFLKESAISGARFAKRQLPRFKVFCIRASRSAAMVLVAMSLWLTYMDWAGIRLLSDEFGIPHSRLFRDLFRDDSFLLHLTASAFVFLYGAISLGILILGNRIPLAFAAVGVFAGAARLSTDTHGLGHDISHMLFASCSGYSDMLANIGVVSLIATGIMATASWATRPSQARDGDFEVATP